jgi:formylglycine-generating enzyme required for sulfatase activity
MAWSSTARLAGVGWIMGMRNRVTEIERIRSVKAVGARSGVRRFLAAASALVLCTCWQAPGAPLGSAAPEIPAPGEPAPRLRLRRAGDDLVLEYFLQSGGAISIFEQQTLSGPHAGLKLLMAGPAPSTKRGALVLPSSSEPGHRFFRLVETPNRLPSHLVWIPPGRFLMGSAPEEQDRERDESPEHWVDIRHGFWLSKYECTQAEYEAIIGPHNSAHPGYNTYPVEMVRWEAAMYYADQLTRREREAGRLPAGYVYRLPTEAEWEYACRAGTTTRYSFGDDPEYTELASYGWWAGNAQGHPHPVGQLRPNPWGLYDMHGNVFEWCYDSYGPYPGASAEPSGPKPGTAHVYRGGSWICPPEVLRSACRHGAAPILGSYIGFRVALAVPVQ